VKILFVDRHLKGRPNATQKEGEELYRAALRLGHEAALAGKDYPHDEYTISNIAKSFDLIIVSENYPEAPEPWGWWNWSDINTPKVFWAIDTHLKNFDNWISDSHFDLVAYNNKNHITSNRQAKGLWMPYGASDMVLSLPIYKKFRDIAFIGTLTPKRKQIINRLNIPHIQAYGKDYYKAIGETTICFNFSISDDLNAKYFEIPACGSFMLTNFNESFASLFYDFPDQEKMFYKSLFFLKKKIRKLLEDKDDLERIAQRFKGEILKMHMFDNRLINLIERFQK